MEDLARGRQAAGYLFSHKVMVYLGRYLYRVVQERDILALRG